MALSTAIEKIKECSCDISHKDIFFGLSGGVDSSTLAVLAKKAGLKVKGFHLVCWEGGDYCTAQDDLKDALAIAAKFDLGLDVIDLKEEYRKLVLDPMLEAYRNGYLPNIDISCNGVIKFDILFGKLVGMAESVLATGHYSSPEFLPKELTGGALIRTLKIPTDVSKDQTYFLSRIIRLEAVMDRVFFPAGLFMKAEIRQLAQELGLSNAKKPDSQGICFVGNVDMKSFLIQFIKKNEGKIVDTAGNIVGKHDGIAFYAVGQRHSFELTKYSSEPLYIVRKNIKDNLLIVGPREEALTSSINIKDYFSIIGKKVFDDLCLKNKIKARFRNLGKLISVENLVKKDDCNFILKICEPEFGLTPGQEVVFYFDNLIVGSGVIEY